MLPKKWRLIYDQDGNAFTFASLSASMNMAIDEAIAKSHPASKSTLRFYTWKKPAVSIGYFQRITPVINWLNHNLSQESRVKSQELKVRRVSYHPPYSTPDSRLSTQDSQLSTLMDIVRRPTGGGVVLHGADLTYSVATGLPRGFVPRNDNSSRNLIPLFYRQMSQAVVGGLRLLGIDANIKSAVGAGFKPAPTQDSGPSLCAQTPVEFDVLVIPSIPPFNKRGNGGIKVAGCAARRFGDTLLLQGYISIGYIADVTAQQLIDAMIKGFTVSLDIELLHGKLTDEEASLAEELNNKKYSRREWNYKR